MGTVWEMLWVLIEASLMNTTFFFGEIRKIFISRSLLSKRMNDLSQDERIEISYL